LREFLVLRDQTCRTPWCDAPIRHGDHIVSRARGGPTSAANGQGLCEACNYTKEAPGWQARPTDHSRPGGHQVEITTPTGHQYVSRPPPQPGSYPQQPPSRIELYFADYVAAA
ncbi:MAG TPA: HNH endonuclease, partial [Actinomycetes bacterium]